MGRRDYEALVIGGGIVGCSVALYLKRHMDKVLILEGEASIIQRASFVNQARVHNGYHYPKSLLTALRSRVNLPRFVSEYPDCIDQSFEKYYAIASHFSDVNVKQFMAFCQRIEAPLEPAPAAIRNLFRSELVEGVFRVQEYAFDAARLREGLLARLRDGGVELRANCQVTKVLSSASQELEVHYESKGEQNSVVGEYVFNCTYSQLNQILIKSGLPIIPLKQEFAEVALVEVPVTLRHIGVTVMCGPFFSTMPFPARGLHTLSHVRYTPHHSWQDVTEHDCRDAAEHLKNAPRRSNYPHMVMDAQRYLPSLRDSRYVDSLWEIKTVLPKSEVDDSRPILFGRDHGLKNFTCILGGKIDNIYDILDELETWRQEGGLGQ